MSQGQVTEYLQKPYARIVIPDGEGGYHSEILEFPGCYAQGDSPEEAYANLEESAKEWIQVLLDRGQKIPEPSSNVGYSGSVLLRLPRGIHRQASKMAARDRTSLNQYLVAAVSSMVGADDFCEIMLNKLRERLAYPFVGLTIRTEATSSDVVVGAQVIRAPIGTESSTTQTGVALIKPNRETSAWPKHHRSPSLSRKSRRL